MTAPERLCYVNCGLPADQCACYRQMASDAAGYEAALRDAAAPFVSPVQTADFARQMREYDAMRSALSAYNSRRGK